MPTPFEVLALPLRREILDRLRAGPRLVGELAAELGVAQPIVSKQLKILRDSGFVAVQPDAQRRRYALRPEPLAAVADWLEPYRWLWERHLDRLGAHLDTMEDPS
ncbi:ArsR/SmtB family transcription factor [Pseudonocardia pini]|uniref:ArsR/SmtB family transcription factor n=1 Tax=Pseudonocardia pini TaxID=2758030 RepID=UPI0015F09C19|nr:metalloregulator ArsR/SmtB family transcription factor [Pseudonocardia pini]